MSPLEREPQPGPGDLHSGRNGVLLAFAGALAGAGALALGIAAKRRHQPSGANPFDEATGRGIPQTPPSRQAKSKGFETEDMSAATMGMLTIGLGLAIAVAIWLMVLMLQSFHARRDEAPSFTAQQQAPITPPLPHLQAAPYSDIAALRRHELGRLAAYAWVDPQHRRARIPIDVAIGRTVGQSLDAAP